MKDDRWREIVGERLEEFVTQKWGTQKKAARILDVAASTLSQYISGERKPSPEHQLKLIRWGFPKELFDLYYYLDKINPEQLTTEQTKQVIINQQLMIMQQSKTIRMLMEHSEKLQKEVVELSKLIRTLSENK